MRKAKAGAGRELHKRVTQGPAAHEGRHSVVIVTQVIEIAQVFHA
jgi:hypothetical protein